VEYGEAVRVTKTLTASPYSDYTLQTYATRLDATPSFVELFAAKQRPPSVNDVSRD
jgi:hypothetical protein